MHIINTVSSSDYQTFYGSKINRSSSVASLEVQKGNKKFGWQVLFRLLKRKLGHKTNRRSQLLPSQGREKKGNVFLGTKAKGGQGDLAEWVINIY